MKEYTILVRITEGNDEFWEGLKESGKTGCDEILNATRDVLLDSGFAHFDIRLVAFTDIGEDDV